MRAGLIRRDGELHRARLPALADRYERLDDDAPAQAFGGAGGFARVRADLEAGNGEAAFAQQRQGVVFQKAGQEGLHSKCVRRVIARNPARCALASTWAFGRQDLREKRADSPERRLRKYVDEIELTHKQ